MTSEHHPARAVGLIFVAVGLLIVAAVGMHAYANYQSTPEARAKEAIRQVLETQAAEWNKGNLDGFMVGYWNSPDLSFIGDNPTSGWEATRERLHKQYPADQGRMGRLSFSDLQIDMLSPTSAFVRGRWQVVQTAGLRGGYFTLIFKKFPDGWRIVHDHTSYSDRLV